MTLRSWLRRSVLRATAPLFLITILPVCVLAQGSDADPAKPPDPPPVRPVAQAENSDNSTPQQPQEDKRVFGVFPNYRTTEASIPFTPIGAKQKILIGLKDSFDWPVYLTSAGFAGLYQLEDQNPSFGQGVEGYARRYGTALADQVIGNMMTESFMPSLLHEDPRYFRLGRGNGTTMHRLFYALSRIIVTRTDSGGRRFNFSEWLGNSAAVAISNAYYPDTRDAEDAVERLFIACATDAISQVGKEFWPDVKHALFHRHEPYQPLISAPSAGR